MSDDGAVAIVVIALVGNPFSPDYARARTRGGASPLDFAAMNVAVYDARGSWWSLRERRIAPEHRSAHGVAIGPSTMQWRGDALVLDLDERTTPFGRPIRGRIVVHPEVISDVDFELDREGRHRWRPIAPLARIDVELEAPSLRFSGHGYHDANVGDEPLDAAFDRWSWSRARSDSAALLTYDVRQRDGASRALTLRMDHRGAIAPLDAGGVAHLGPSRWRLPRTLRTSAPDSARLVRSLEDGPFYSRALVDASFGGERLRAMHEVLDAERLRSAWVRFLTGFRMGRAA